MNNFVYYFSMFTEEQLIPIYEEINEICSDLNNRQTINHQLAGHLNYQYELNKCKKHVENILLPYVYDFDNQSNYIKSLELWKNPPKISLDSLWVNFQARTEFNPPHTHSGLFSFVSWLKVPYDIKDEIALYPKSNERGVQQTAHFNFHYLDPYGGMYYYRLPVDRSWENRIIIFPAKATHSVNPFYTSNEYRISISGNFFPV